jgi:HAD superfamily hydrolase (TIGR01509 family)
MTDIKTIFFDLGGVLLTNGWDPSQRADVLPRFGLDPAEYNTRHEVANYSWERGLSTVHDYFDKTVFYEPRKFTFDDIWTAVKAESKVLHPECFEIVAQLAATGRYQLCTLNNESRELNDHRIQAFCLKKYFTVFISSGYVNEMKPHRNIYRSALEITQADPAKSVFIDDRGSNIVAAQEMGMQGIPFSDPKQLRAELTKLGVVMERI